MLDVRVVYSPGISDAERRMLELVVKLPRAADDLRALDAVDSARGGST